MTSLRPSPLMKLLGAIFLFATNVFAASAVLGVDLGTEYITASLVKPGIPLDIVLTKDSRRKETAAVAFKPPRGGPKEGEYPERAYGADAMAIIARFPGDVYPNLKALLGLSAEDPAVADYAARHPALDLQAHSTKGTVAFKSKALTPEVEPWAIEELLAMQLQSIRKNAEVATGDGTSVQSIVLTVPAFYTVEEKRAIQTAAELANLKVLSLISDGLAVGLNYAMTRQFPNINQGEKPEYHMVFDMGAGSTKATVLRFQSRNVKDVGKFNKTVQEIQSLGNGWDRTLGGDALNYVIVDDMISKFVDSKAAQKASVAADAVKAHGRAVAKLSKDAERARQVLSANQNTQANFEGLFEDIDFKYKITRAEFETLAEPHAKRLGVVFNEALKAAGLDVSDLTSVIMHGGASRTPFVQKVLEDAAGSADKVRSNVNADEAAVLGAGFRAAGLSPSFRVKDIRILEGATYPSGIKWTKSSNNMLQHQRLWTSVSPLGGPAKELTFTDLNDFSATFYQQVESEDQDVAVFTTTNLTATAAALKEKYPSCTDADIRFKLGVKLRGENGEVEIVKAAVECEAEVTEKEGFVDGVKNLFGFGKKDQQPLKGEDKDTASEESEEAIKAATESTSASSAADSSKSTTASGKDAKATPASEEAKAEIKKQLVSIPVKFELEKSGKPQFSTSEVGKAKDRLKAFAASDKARMQREEALNQLEGYTYKVRDLLESETFIAVSTEAERTELSKTLSEVSDWLYEEGADASKTDLKAKFKQLEDLASPIQKRTDEAAERPELVTGLKDALGQTVQFIGTIRGQIDEYEAFHAAESAKASESAEPAKETPSEDDLEDEDAPEKKKERTTDDLKKEIGPVPPMYQREDLEEVETLQKEVAAWLEDLEARQDALPVTADPVLLVRDLKAKRQALDKAGKDLALKAVRNFEKKKKATQSTGDKKKSKTKSADQAQHTIKFGDGENMPTQEELEELVAKLKLRPEDQEKKEENKHDEL